MNLISNLIPKNFIVANMVEILTDDPENGVQKIYDMSKNFIKDPETLSMIQGIKQYYDNHKSVQMYVKNIAYNTHKNCLNHCIQNIGVNAMWEGLALRQKSSELYQVEIPHAIVINPSMTCGVGCEDCPSSIMVKPLMSISQLNKVVSDAKSLGIYCVIVNGGDPFLYEELMSLYEQHKDVEFFVLTPGINFKQSICEKLISLGNVIPFIVLEGEQKFVDGDSKNGLYQEIQKGMNFLKTNGLFYGVVTPTSSNNLPYVVSDSFIIPLIRNGSRLNAYVITSTEQNQLNKEEKEYLLTAVNRIRSTKPYLSFHFNSLTPFIDRCVTGPYAMTLELGEFHKSYVLPQITAQNIRGKTLIEFLKEQKKN